MSVSKLCGLILVLGIVAGACSSSKDEESLPLPSQAAIVNGVVIPAGMVEQLVFDYLSITRTTPEGEPMPPLPLEQARRAILDYVIRSEILDALARANGVEIDDSLIELALADVGSQNFRAAGTTKAQIGRSLKSGELSRELGEVLFPDITISEQELIDAFTQLAPNFEGGWVAKATVAYFLSVETANSAIERVANGEDLTDVAEQLGAIEAGSMGEVSSRSALPEHILETIKNLDAGAISEPVAAAAGWLVFYVDEMSEIKEQTFEEAKPTVRESLEDQARQKMFTTWFEGRVKEAVVEVDRFYGIWDSDSGRVRVTANPS